MGVVYLDYDLVCADAGAHTGGPEAGGEEKKNDGEENQDDSFGPSHADFLLQGTLPFLEWRNCLLRRLNGRHLIAYGSNYNR